VESALADILSLVIALIAVVILGYVFDRAIRKVGQKMEARPQHAKTARRISATVFAGLGSIAVIALLVSSSALVWTGITGVAVLAVTLALQSTLSNVIAGILNTVDGILQIGDRVEIAGISGTVTHIGLRHSWIRSTDGSTVVVSNSTISSGPLRNFSLEDRIRSTKGPLNWYQTRIARLSLLDRKDGEQRKPKETEET
jgi:small conductance mechanosensitive channel